MRRVKSARHTICWIRRIACVKLQCRRPGGADLQVAAGTKEGAACFQVAPQALARGNMQGCDLLAASLRGSLAERFGERVGVAEAHGEAFTVEASSVKNRAAAQQTQVTML